MSESTVPRFKLRIENLSDLIFGLALSIGSLILIEKLPQNPSELISGVVIFAFSFLIVVWIWTGYTQTMAFLPYEIGGTYLLNILLLFCVAVEPYLFYVVTEGQSSLTSFASAVYAVDVGGMMLILSSLKYLVLHQKERGSNREIPSSEQESFKRAMFAEFAGGLIFTVTVLPFFWIPTFPGDYLRFDVWYIAMAVLAIGTRIGVRMRRAAK